MIECKCPSCASALSVPDSLTGQVETCPDCGSNFVVPLSQPVASTTVQVLCPYCNGDISVDVLKCRHCGEWLDKRTSLDSGVSVKPVETPRGTVRTWNIVKVTVVVMITITIISFLLGMLYLWADSRFKKQMADEAQKMWQEQDQKEKDSDREVKQAEEKFWAEREKADKNKGLEDSPSYEVKVVTPPPSRSPTN